MTREQYLELCQRNPYYKGRWGYYAAAADILKREGITNVLEVGPAAVPIVPGSQLMMSPKASPFLRGEPPTYLWDATQTPWPIGTKRYDAAVALQVLEHLGERQREAFKELKRVSRFVVLSFPYRWNAPKDPVHHNIDDAKITRWTMGAPMKDRLVIPDDESPKLLRLVCSFAFPA
ncbi:MAG TPA: hypothetical protein VF796_00670 [Humisphaera sp.]